MKYPVYYRDYFINHEKKGSFLNNPVMKYYPVTWGLYFTIIRDPYSTNPDDSWFMSLVGFLRSHGGLQVVTWQFGFLRTWQEAIWMEETVKLGELPHKPYVYIYIYIQYVYICTIWFHRIRY